MADKKETETESDETERSEEDQQTVPVTEDEDVPDTVDTEDETWEETASEDELPTETEFEDMDPSEDVEPEDVEDAEIISEMPAEHEMRQGVDEEPTHESPELSREEADAEMLSGGEPAEAIWDSDTDTSEDEDVQYAEPVVDTGEPVSSEDLADTSYDPDVEPDIYAASYTPTDPVIEEEIEAESEDKPEPETEDSLLSKVGGGSEAVRSVDREPIVVERRGGMIGGFVGGIVATLGLAFAAPFIIPHSMMPDFGAKAVRADLEAQSETVAALQTDVQALQSSVSEAATAADLSALQAQTEESMGSLQSTLETVQTEAAPASGVEEIRSQMQALQQEREALLQRIDELEKRPIAEATDPASIAAVEAYGREVSGLREQLDQMMARAEEMVAQATTAADAAVKAASTRSEEVLAGAQQQAEVTAEQARQVARAAAMVDIQAALETGQPYEKALAGLSGVEVPPALADQAAEGVPTLADVLEAYPPAARAALKASLRVSNEETVEGRLTTFLRTQTGLRSLAPREGDDPDAVLSRAEAAAAEGRLHDAIDEISALPEAGQEQMADWVEMARRRADAAAAADDLAASLTTN
ncbi:hypothetical protein [Tropicimonas isoalkanivorans]|uniref:Mitochondrial inner membrane protein n=1 Tax=Tropicimonas isoalkanivorans TaxID=441112 RepID=A0A1I1R9K2_9RHOB|nr:hypothetical protein [Tropicimonas isoalkanivorans]SFD28838.1 hypothetical protein SAMN04488094_1277 [Tropicimonas isoalkanivorans]